MSWNCVKCGGSSEEGEKYLKSHGRVCRPCLRPMQRAAVKRYNQSEHGSKKVIEYRARTKQQKLKASQSLRAKKRQLMVEAKSKPCADCKRVYPPYVMDFDHLSDKKFCISKDGAMTGLAKLIEEIAKCDVVCANCHRIRTHTRRFGNVGQAA